MALGMGGPYCLAALRQFGKRRSVPGFCQVRLLFWECPNCRVYKGNPINFRVNIPAGNVYPSFKRVCGVFRGCCVPVARVQQPTEPAGETLRPSGGVLGAKPLRSCLLNKKAVRCLADGKFYCVICLNLLVKYR